MSSVTVGIIGAGRIGRLHAENVLCHLPRMTLKTITDPMLDADWLSRHDIPCYGDDAALVLDDPDINAVLICSPSETHVPLIIAAAQANKHIFCEKPISLDVPAVNTALQAVEQAGVKLQIGFNRRFDPEFAALAQHVREGAIGRPHLFCLTFRDPEPPPITYVAASGGIFLDMTIHDFDMARFLSGEEITEVFAMGSTLINPEIARYNDVDTAVIQLRFASGALGVIDNSRQAVYGYDQRVEVFGSSGSIQAHNKTPTRIKHSTVDGTISDNPLYFFLDRYRDSYINELDGFCESILNNTPCMVSGQDGLIPVMIGLAAQRSLIERRPIAL